LNKRLLICALGFIVFLNLACSGTPSPVQKSQNTNMVVATTSDVTVGDNRIGFSLFDFEGESIVVDQVLVEAIFYPPNENEGVIKDTSTAYWMSIPGVAGKGLYVTDIFFDVSGAGTQENPNYWEIVGSFVYEDESTWSKAAIVVNEYSSITSIGERVPKSVTLTADNEADLKFISTDPDPDVDLYRLSIDEAVTNGKPSVIVFATPALCVSQVCGPIVDMVSTVKNRYTDRVDFIHVEVFANPNDLVEQGRFSGQQVDAVSEWGLVTEPWLFVVDAEGRLADKFEIFVTSEEVIEAIESVVN